MLTLAREQTLNVKAIKAHRNSLELTMEQASDAAGFSGGRQQCNNIENARTSPDVPISTLVKLAKALECEPADLLK